MTISIVSNNTAAPYIGTYAGVEDSKFVESTPTTPGPATGEYLYATSWTSTTRTHSVVKFPTSGIGADQEVSAASFNIRVEGGLGDFAIYRLKVPFVVGQVSWNERSTGVSWTSPGGLNSTDVDMTPLATATAAATGWLTLNSAALTALVDGWAKGTIPNHGLLIAYYPDAVGGSKNIRFFRSPAAYDKGPSLVITHALAPTGPTVTSVTQTSGGTEGSPAVMTVALSGATSGSTNFAATLAGVTATGSGTDFTSDLASATYSNGVTFSGGNMVVPDAVSGWTVTIATTSDTLDEADETATLTVGGTAGTLTITDDDVQPTVTISDATEVAGTVTFVATLSAASGKTITFLASTADGTKTAGVDYTALTGSTVTFNPGETTKNIVVTAL